jgi:ADP-dependent NAD(P)H-hydrate dehydratase
LVLTPHHGEMATMLGVPRQSIDDDPPAAAGRVAARLGCHVILKNQTTLIAAPSSEQWLFQDGVAGLATAGSGDVLAGILTGLIARGADATTAALWSVWLHAAAGRALSKRIGSVGFLARELLGELPALLPR